MIAVRIPEEIRKYKEKIAFGLTARQLICTIATFVVCVPLYWYGRGFMQEDILAWIIILIAVPLEAVGFVKINGMPMEKFAVAALKFEVLYPRKRKFKTLNVWREWQNQAVRMEQPKSRKERKRIRKMEENERLERLFLLSEAEEKGMATYSTDPEAEKVTQYDVDAQELLTVRTRNGGKKPGGNNRRDKKKKQKKKSRLQIQAESIEAKMRDNPQYVRTKKEDRILAAWNKKKIADRKREIQKGKKEIVKSSKKMEKRRRAKMVIPNTTQKSIPYIADYEEGLFEVTPNKFSKMYRLKDINYRTGREEEQITIFVKLGEFLNYFSEEMRFAFIIDNRVVSKAEQERKVFKKMKGDRYDGHRKEYNNILRRQIIAGRNDMQVQKYITVTIDANSPIEALLRFHKIDAEIITNLRRIGSDGEVLSTDERLEYYHDKYRKGREGEFQINYDFIKTQGISSKDYIAPSYMSVNRKDIEIEDEYYRVLFLNNLPASLQDEFLFDLCGEGWTESQQDMIDKGAFTAADYEEYARIKDSVLKQFELIQEKNFSVSENGKGVPFRFPDWQGKQAVNEGIEQPEEKKTAREQLSEQLKAGIRDVMNSDTYKNWLDTSSRLYYNNYSFNNAVLVYMQKPEATYTMGYDAWKDYGRGIAKGARGAKVFVPVMAYEKSQGALYRMITNNLKEQLKQNPGDVAVYKVGTSRLDFTMNGNGQVGYRINGIERGIFENQQQVQRYIQNAILGKVPMYFTVGTVFDVKDTIIPEYLWVKKGYTKDEVVKGEDGKPIKNSRGEIKIRNTPERQARFQTQLDMGMTEKPGEQMETLYESLKSVCERNGVHVYEREREGDETLKGGADGYFSRHFDEQNPRGFIVMPTDLEPTRKAAVLMHEAAHSDLHGNLEVLAREMGEKAVPAHMREIQAESVAYAVARRFGIETDTSSFQYLAAYSKGFELQDLHKSMDVIYRECKKMTQEIAAELDARGLTMELTEKAAEPMQKETIETLCRQYAEYILGESEDISGIRPELPKLAVAYRDNADLLGNIKEQKYCVDRRESEVDVIRAGIEKLQGADSREQQEKAISEIEAAKRRLAAERGKFSELSQTFVETTLQGKNSLREEFLKEPKNTLEKMKADHSRLAELSCTQLDYVAKSDYVKREYASLLRNSADKFVDEVCGRAESLDSVISKKGCFVEINSCEQWTDKPVFKSGALVHPKVANDIIKQGEMQIRALRHDAEKKGEYFPYTKCRLTVFAMDKDNSLAAHQTSIYIGDASQVSLADHITRECRDDFLTEAFEKGTREKGAKEKIMFNAPEPDQHPEAGLGERDREGAAETLESWEGSIQGEKNAEQGLDREGNHQLRENVSHDMENRQNR